MNLFGSDEKKSKDDIEKILMDELMERFMPMLEKKLPSIEEGIESYLTGKEDNIEKIIVITSTSNGIGAMILNKELAELNIEEGGALASVKSADLIKLFMNGEFKKLT